MRVEDIEYMVDGRRMVGYLAVDDAVQGRRPAVLVAHEGPGLDRHAKDIAERLAALGYVASPSTTTAMAGPSRWRR